MSGKRSYSTYAGRPSVGYKAARMVGGKVLRYNPQRPALGSSRAAAAAPSLARTGGYSFQASGGRELNFKDTTIDGISVSTTPVLTLLNGMTQGTTASTRIGRRIGIKSVEWRFNMATSSATTWTSNRYMIIVDRQANAAAAAFADIYDVADPSTLRNISNMTRFQVLFDSQEFTMIGDNSGTGASSYDSDSLATAHKGYLKVNIPVQYNVGTAGTIGDIQTNALYFVTIGNGSTAVTDCNINKGTVRIRYGDN